MKYYNGSYFPYTFFSILYSVRQTISRTLFYHLYTCVIDCSLIIRYRRSALFVQTSLNFHAWYFAFFDWHTFSIFFLNVSFSFSVSVQPFKERSQSRDKNVLGAYLLNKTFNVCICGSPITQEWTPNYYQISKEKQEKKGSFRLRNLSIRYIPKKRNVYPSQSRPLFDPLIHQYCVYPSENLTTTNFIFLPKSFTIFTFPLYRWLTNQLKSKNIRKKQIFIFTKYNFPVIPSENMLLIYK